MMRALRWLFLAVLALGLIGLALANRELVTLRVLPPEAGEFLGYGWAVQVPMFLVIFAGVLIGLFIGFVWEWLREHKIRSTASQATRKASRLEGEVERLGARTQGPKDEVLALLEKPGR